MMFLQHANTLGFLKLDPESQVFMVFPIAARKTLAQTTVECLLNLDPHPDQITTASHMRSLMEIVGQAFDLPFEEDGSNVVASALDVYRLWLCSATYQPSPVRDDPEFFNSRMLRHISMVFRPRAGAIDRHIQIGKKALDVYVQVAKEAGPLFSPETWNEFLKLYLAVADSLLSQAVDAVALADRLQGHVLRVLFEIWFLSGNRQEDLWGILKSLFINWRHRLATVTAWTSVLFGLVQRVLGITYGEGVGTPAVSFTIGESPVTMVLDNEHAVFSMYKVLHLIGDLESVKDPGIYNEAIRGLGFLATALVNVSAKLKGRDVIPPDGNSILHLVGPLLLEAITTFPRKLDHGKATAVEAVCKLFVRKASTTDFHPRYLAMWYHGLDAALKSGSGHLLSMVLTNCVRLFGANFRGVNMLMPSFTAAIYNVLSCRTQIQGVMGSMALLRRASLLLALQLVCWPNRYNTLAFCTRNPLQADSDVLPDIVTYEDMNPYFHAAFMNALETVTEAQNYSLFFSVAFLFILENMDRDLSFGREFVVALGENLSGRRFAETSSVMDALRFLDDLSIISSDLNSDESVSVHVVQSLCTLLSDLLDMSVTPSAPSDDLVCAAIHCMHRWLDGPWILVNVELLHKVWSSLQYCLNGNVGMHPASEAIQDAALYATHHLLSRVGHACDPEFPSSTLREAELMEKNGLTTADVMCFMLDGSLYSLVKDPAKPGQGHRIGVTVIMRTPAATSVWRCALNYFAVPVPELPQFDHDDTPILPDTYPPQPFSQDVLNLMNGALTDDQRAVQETLSEAVVERVFCTEQVRESLLQQGQTMPPLRRLEHTEPPDGWDNVASRMFMATFGFLSRGFAGRMSVLPASKIQDVLDFSSRFDAMSTRESFRTALVYLRRSHESNISLCRDCSPQFQRFVDSLGIRAECSKHPEFGLDSVTVGDEFVLACDKDTAVAYVSPSWMPVDMLDEQDAFLTQDVDVLVLWCEDADELRLKTKVTFLLCIQPLLSGLFRIRVVSTRTGGSPPPGPLLDGAVVSLYVLPEALTRTVANMARSVNESYLFDQTFGRRREALEEFFRETLFQAPKLVQTWVTSVAKPAL